MTRRTNRLFLAVIAEACIAALAFFFALNDVARDPAPPDDVPRMAGWLAAHPADWLTASVLTDRALDTSLSRRFELWRAASALATNLAPARRNARAAIVRSGLFHWYELDERDRGRVLQAVAPLLHDNDLFDQLVTPLWTLTRDLTLLERENPGTPHALLQLREIAATNGLFDDYRRLRDEVRVVRLRDFQSRRKLNFWELLPRPIEAADEPLILAILAELEVRPADFDSSVAPLVDYVLRHDLRPLGGLSTAVHAKDLSPALRARLALRLGMRDVARELEMANAVNSSSEWHEYFLDATRDAAKRGERGAADIYLARAMAGGADERREWSGLCGSDVCTSATAWVRAGGSLPIHVRAVQSDEVAPYVEVYVDDALAAEAEVADAVRLDVPLGAAGLHRIEVRIANPLTRNRIQRRVAFSS